LPEVLKERNLLLAAIRSFFLDRGYLEVETPLRIPAPVPEPHIVPVESEGWYLQTSPELCMKRLLARGVPKLFQIARCFRKGERGRFHLPEFTMLEWYRAGIEYHALMEECEEMLREVAARLGVTATLSWQGREIDLASPWERITVAEAFERHAPYPVDEALARGVFDETLVVYVEPHLGVTTPTFLYDYPLELGALARPKPGNPDIAERFELYVATLELANGFSELTDPVEQRRRFEHDRELIRESGREPAPIPSRFLAELGEMPGAAGVALGVDRLAMLLFDRGVIDQVVAFTPEEL